MNKPATIDVPTSFKARFTTAEFLRMCEVDAFGDMKIELVGGELERMNPPMGAHSHRQTQVVGLLWGALGEERCKRLAVEAGIDLGDDTVVACDAAILLAPMSEHRWVRASEVLLVIEVAQTTMSRDMVWKRSRYAAAGVPHYWVVDGDSCIVHVHSSPIEAAYTMVHTVRFGEPLPVPVPGSDTTIVIA